MKILRNSTWTRRGCSLLWEPKALISFAHPSEVVSLRRFIEISRCWPDDLPSNAGNAIVVAGVEGCLDALSADDAATWVDRDLRRLVFEFQDAYQGEAALIFWLPSGRGRIHFALASEDYSWSGIGESRLPLGHLLWAGARHDAQRIVMGDPVAEEGDPWVGMYHPRIS